MIDAAQHLGLVHHLYGRNRSRFPRDIPREDIVQAGMLGLVKAAARYAPMPGGTFPALARCYILGEMFAEVGRWYQCRGRERTPTWRPEAFPPDEAVHLRPDWQRFVSPDPTLALLDLGLLLARLTPQQRWLVEEIALTGRSVTQVTLAMGLPMATVSKRYRYAVGKLRDLAGGGPRTYRRCTGHRRAA